ncbi:isochorismatase family protein [Aeromicrobium choanae]|uniref:Nicotinamidase-related amidase n=1 Tax=Aeromicrobium choanae TaxID=1736691 RepID=A0A1T4Z8Z2_9ACTN|nr:isochorismatase family protein [Aeromicrobium choanae]SKB10071.1 Nicotinamidase-related amidase [Aeromicrobium choanae]
MNAPRRALIVIDVQNEYFDGVLQIQSPPRDQSLAHITKVIEVAAAQGLPVVVVQHQTPEGAPVFAEGSHGWSLHPEIEALAQPTWKRVVKHKSSVFADTDVASWLAEQGVDTISIVGYMTNNCDLGTVFGAEELGLDAEVLSDATGAIHLANEAGKVSAAELHAALLVLLQSNLAAVASTEDWAAAVRAGAALPKSDLGTSATQGRAAFAG